MGEGLVHVVAGRGLFFGVLRPVQADDAIYQQGLTIYTPYPARPKPPEPNKPPDVEEEPPKA